MSEENQSNYNNNDSEDELKRLVKSIERDNYIYGVLRNIAIVIFLYVVAGSIWPRVFPDHPLLGEEHNFFPVKEPNNENDEKSIQSSDEETPQTLEGFIKEHSVTSKENADPSVKCDTCQSSKNSTSNDNVQQQIELIICGHCEGTGTVRYPCWKCKGLRFDKEGDDCRVCQAYGELPDRCSVCDGKRRVPKVVIE